MRKQKIEEVKQTPKLDPLTERWYKGFKDGQDSMRKEIIEDVIKFLDLDNRYQKIEEMD